MTRTILPAALAACLATGCGPSALTPIAAGGSGQSPWVLATGVKIDNNHTRRTGQDTPAQYKLYLFRPSSIEPALTFQAPAATRSIGAIGDQVWLMSGKEPMLVDVTARRVVFAARELGDRHAPIAGGVTVSNHRHPDFVGPMHRETGDLGITANGVKYVLTTKGSLVTFEDYLKAHPADIPGGLICRGGRSRVCGSDACVKFIPDNSGGQRLEVSASPRSRGALPKATSEPMFGATFVGGRQCIRTLGDAGPLVVAHQSKPGRNVPRDRISAIDLRGKTKWTVDYRELYGDRERRAHVIDIVDDRVVTGVSVKSFFSAGVAVASIDAAGTPSPAP